MKRTRMDVAATKFRRDGRQNDVLNRMAQRGIAYAAQVGGMGVGSESTSTVGSELAYSSSSSSIGCKSAGGGTNKYNASKEDFDAAVRASLIDYQRDVLKNFRTHGIFEGVRTGKRTRSILEDDDIDDNEDEDFGALGNFAASGLKNNLVEAPKNGSDAIFKEGDEDEDDNEFMNSFYMD